MFFIFNVLIAVIIFLSLTEICSRIFYKKKFRIKWKPKIIGEYPYNRFLEKTKPPLYFQFKRKFHSKMVNINRFGMRSKEPMPTGENKRLLLIGESVFFGSKLVNEKNLWCNKLEELLEQKEIKNWDILNAGFPGYNTVQFYEWWEKTLKDTKPNVLILQCGGNDITQAYVFGDKWKSGKPWQWDFMMKQQRKSKWWQKTLFYSCFYFLYRRKQLTERKGFESSGNVFKLNECEKSIIENAEKIISDAKSISCKVILCSLGFVYDLNSIDENPPQLDSVQSNWRESLETTGKPIIKFNNFWVNDFAKKIKAPAINLQELFWNHPQRYEMYLDVGHWNKSGHNIVANAIFNKLQELNWW